MPLHFDDDDNHHQAPQPAALPEPTEAPARGQQLYEALGAVVSETDETTLLVLVDALRNQHPWERLAPKLRALIADLDGRLFVEEEE